VKKKVIKFGAELDWLEKPNPSRIHIPEWYKKVPLWAGSGKPEIRSTKTNSTVKACSPFLDSFLTGYTVELWQDIQIEKASQDDQINITWAIEESPLLSHRDPELTQGFPISSEYRDTHFVWKSPYAMSTPKGYSLLITHPLNRLDLPFTTLSAVVDADKYPISDGAVPFFLKKDFYGIIKKGTPLYQVIPVKRDEWESEFSKELFDEARVYSKKSRSISNGFYKQFQWSKKSYS
jgi:hypothetical protein